MSAPVATLPAAENDGRPSRPAIFQTRAGALAHAARSARLASASGAYRTLTGVDNCFEPIEGGVAFVVSLGMLAEWHLVTVEGTNLVRLVQRGLRSALASCLEKAKAHDIAANMMKPGSAVYRMHTSYAAEERNRARELELRLTVGAVSVAEVVERASELCLAMRVARLKAVRVCRCGKPALPKRAACRSCDENAFDARNRALPADLQRD